MSCLPPPAWPSPPPHTHASPVQRFAAFFCCFFCCCLSLLHLLLLFPLFHCAFCFTFCTFIQISLSLSLSVGPLLFCTHILFFPLLLLLLLLRCSDFSLLLLRLPLHNPYVLLLRRFRGVVTFFTFVFSCPAPPPPPGSHHPLFPSLPPTFLPAASSLSPTQRGCKKRGWMRKREGERYSRGVVGNGLGKTNKQKKPPRPLEPSQHTTLSFSRKTIPPRSRASSEH